MSLMSDLRVKAAKAWPFETLPPMDWSAQAPTFAEANPAVIRSALTRARRRPSGNWYAFAASSQIAAQAWGGTVAGVQIVAWRGADGGLLVAPRACPHLGADLSTAPVECGTLVCPWHGLRLSDRRHGAWKPSRRTTMASCAGCASTPPVARLRPTRRSRRRGPGIPGWLRCPASKVFVSLAMSSPTGWTRGTADGSTRIPSPDSRFTALLPPTTT